MAQTIQDFVVQLRMICNSTLHAYLARIADTEDKRQYLHFSCTAADAYLYRKKMDMDLTHRALYEILEGFELQPANFAPSDLRIGSLILTTHMTYHGSFLSGYLLNFRSDRERSREFHYDAGMWSAIVATRYLRTLSDLR